MIDIIEQKSDAIAALCCQHHVRRLELFGSAASGDFDANSSDFDFVVDFADRSPGYARRFFEFETALAALLDRDVDLITERSIRNPIFRAAVDESRVAIYEAPDRQAVA